MDNINSILYQSQTGKKYQYHIRRVNLQDIPTIVQMRYQMFLDMGFLAEQFPLTIINIWIDYFFNHVGDNSYVGWLVVYKDDSSDQNIPWTSFHQN